MAISQMSKVMIVSHRAEAAQLLESLQGQGICQILNAEEAMVSKDWPELATASDRPTEIEELLNRLTKSIEFLKRYAQSAKGMAGVLSPRTVIDQQQYDSTVSDRQNLGIIEQCEQTESAIEKLKSEIENLNSTIQMLEPWSSLQLPVEEIGLLETTTCPAGLIPEQQFEQIEQQLSELGSAIEQAGQANNKYACLVVCLNEDLNDVQKLLRAAEFEQVSFEKMTGTVPAMLEHHNEQLSRAKKQLEAEYEKAAELSENLLKLQILSDHYENLLNREQTRGSAPATEQTVILEGWAKKTDLPRLEKIVSSFGASTLSRIEPADDEEIPVEIENKNIIRPFEVITRLYGMPRHFEVDPTVFLAPFFAIFFALCLTDAGYGLVIIALMAFFIKKIQGDKKLIWMLAICSVVTLAAGALTGGWFGDGIQQFIPALGPLRKKMMLFDPLEKPMIFFGLALALGYFQILTGLVIAFVHNLKRKQYIAAACDQLTWLVMLNSIVIFIAGKGGYIPHQIGGFFGKLALIPAATILLFSHREGGWAGRLGMGAYNLFSAIFYMGDVLSYLRLMALGMVTAGLAMAINVIAKIIPDILNQILGLFGLHVPAAIGIVLVILVLVVGHVFNLGLSALSAFVHTLRLQYVEFFPKFFAGGGRSFEPLTKKYKHIYIENKI